jgi:hypothetical protein
MSAVEKKEESKKEEQKRNFMLRGYDYLGELAEENRGIATTIGAGAGYVIGKKVFVPVIDKVTGAVKGMIARKATEKVTEKAAGEVKNAFSLTDALGTVASGIGKLRR